MKLEWSKCRQTFKDFHLLMNEDLIYLCQVLETLRHTWNARRSSHELRPSSATCRQTVILYNMLGRIHHIASSSCLIPRYNLPMYAVCVWSVYIYTAVRPRNQQTDGCVSRRGARLTAKSPVGLRPAKQHSSVNERTALASMNECRRVMYFS